MVTRAGKSDSGSLSHPGLSGNRGNRNSAGDSEVSWGCFSNSRRRGLTQAVGEAAVQGRECPTNTVSSRRYPGHARARDHLLPGLAGIWAHAQLPRHGGQDCIEALCIAHSTFHKPRMYLWYR